MIRQRQSTPPDPPDEAHALLSNLLGTPVPRGEDLPRPVTLRSTAEQRRIALRSFLLRTWFDHALHHAERLLLLALVAFGVYWLADGYGRDWLYQLQGQASLAAPAQVPMPAEVARPAPTGAPTAAASLAGVTLPFTTPDMEQAADYLAPQTIAAPAVPADPRPVRLLLPGIGVDTPVTEVFVGDGAWQVADYAAGYHHGTALPGNAGNTVMAGHAGLRGGVFRNLGALQAGDEILVETGSWRYRYQVRELKSVWPTQIEVMAPTPTPVLTLITCTAWDTRRLIVVADLVDSRPLH